MENLFVENQIRMHLVDPNVLAQIVQELTTKNMNYYLHNTEFFFFMFFFKYTYCTFFSTPTEQSHFEYDASA